MNRKSDVQLRDDLLAELKWDTHVQPTEIGVEVKDGVVTLSGTVDSWAKRMAAKDAAHRVAGVLDVANDVIVHTQASPGRTDAQIAEQARCALEWDVFVPHEKIHTTVSGGVLTLEGEVVTATQRADCERAVRNLLGVLAVVNQIKVRSSIRSDEVQRAISSALMRHATREAERMHVDVTDGTVKVVGKVDSWAEREAVLGAVWGTRGVRAVDDRISVL
jgi:osmotically-inducible protein OsmY